MTLPLQSGPGYDPDLLLLNPDPYHYPTLDPYTCTLVLYMVLTLPLSLLSPLNRPSTLSVDMALIFDS